MLFGLITLFLSVTSTTFAKNFSDLQAAAQQPDFQHFEILLFTKEKIYEAYLNAYDQMVQDFQTKNISLVNENLIGGKLDICFHDISKKRYQKIKLLLNQPENAEHPLQSIAKTLVDAIEKPTEDEMNQIALLTQTIQDQLMLLKQQVNPNETFSTDTYSSYNAIAEMIIVSQNNNNLQILDQIANIFEDNEKTLEMKKEEIAEKVSHFQFQAFAHWIKTQDTINTCNEEFYQYLSKNLFKQNKPLMENLQIMQKDFETQFPETDEIEDAFLMTFRLFWSGFKK